MDDTMLGYIARTTAIDEIIDTLAHSDNPNNEDLQYEVQESAGIWFKDMTADETEYIVNQVNKKWHWYH